MITVERALSVRQPWASLIAAGRKSIEIRTWRTDYRGPLAIHAAGARVGCRTCYGRAYHVSIGGGYLTPGEAALRDLSGAHVTPCACAHYDGPDIARALSAHLHGATPPRAALVAIVDLVDVRDADPFRDEKGACFRPAPGDYAWVLGNPRPIEPRPMGGKLSLWRLAAPLQVRP